MIGRLGMLGTIVIIGVFWGCLVPFCSGSRPGGLGSSAKGGVERYGMKRGGHKWGQIILRTEQDLDKVVAALEQAYHRIREAIKNNENTGWYAELEGDEEDDLEAGDNQVDTALD